MEQLQPVNYVMVSATTAETLSYAANFGTFSGPFTLEIKASYKQKQQIQPDVLFREWFLVFIHSSCYNKGIVCEHENIVLSVRNPSVSLIAHITVHTLQYFIPPVGTFIS